MADPNTTGKAGQVRIQLTTRHADIELPADTGPLLVSDNFKRYQLSTLVNSILQAERPIPFEFLVNGQFLRTSIDDFLTANGISAETTLTVEYVRAIIPPLHVASYEHDDWVSSVDVLSASSPAGSDTVVPGQERILSGGYDGLFRVWDMSSNVLATSPDASHGGHTLAVKAVKFTSPRRIVSAGMDRSIRLWNFEENERGASIVPTLELYGHQSSVDSLAAHIPSQRLLSASTDHTVGYWTTSKSDAPEAPSGLGPSNSSKRRKLSQAAPSSKPAPQRGPLSLMTGHTGPVSSVIFAPNDHTVAHSASWDRNLRTWDLATSRPVDARALAHPLLSLAALPGVGLLAAGSSARHVALVDPRADAAAVSALTLRGHTNAVVALDADPRSAYRLVSGSHDGTCRVWDVRSVRPAAPASGGSGAASLGQVGESMYVIQRESLEGRGKGSARSAMPPGGEGVKVFGVRWDRDVGIVSAGEDKRVQINRQDDASE